MFEKARFERPQQVQALLAAAERASHLGISLLDSQTRVEYVNASLAKETRATIDHHIGKTSREIIGELATQIEPVYEAVLRTGKPASGWLAGHVRDTVEVGHWFDYAFPIFDTAGRVQQLGVFVVNVTAEKEAAAILNALPGGSRFSVAQAGELLTRLDEAVHGYYLGLALTFQELAKPATEAAQKVDYFQSKLQRLDNEIRLVRELVYAVLAEFDVPCC